MGSFWISNLLAFRLELLGSPGSSFCKLTLQILGLASLHNRMSQSFVINLILYLHVHTHILLVLFLQGTLKQLQIPNYFMLSSVEPKHLHVEIFSFIIKITLLFSLYLMARYFSALKNMHAFKLNVTTCEFNFRLEKGLLKY